MKVPQNYPTTVWNTIKNTRYGWIPAICALASHTMGHTPVEGASIGVMLSQVDLLTKPITVLRNSLRHELGHFIVLMDGPEFVRPASIHRSKHRFAVKPEIPDAAKRNFLSLNDKEAKHAFRTWLSGRQLSRLSGNTCNSSGNLSDWLKEYIGLLGKPHLTGYYLTQARKDTKAILRQYPETLIEEILDDMEAEFRASSNGLVWSRENGKIQELEKRLKAGKIKFNQAG